MPRPVDRWVVFTPSGMTLAIDQSSTFTTPRSVTQRLSGLRSRWITWSSWAASTAQPAETTTWNAKAIEALPAVRARAAPSDTPSRSCAFHIFRRWFFCDCGLIWCKGSGFMDNGQPFNYCTGCCRLWNLRGADVSPFP